MKCVTTAWDLYEAELYHFLLSRVKDTQLAEDL